MNRDELLSLLRIANELRQQLPLENMDLNYELAEIIRKLTNELYTIKK